MQSIDVKALRKSLKMTQVEFAKLLGITQSGLSFNESRHRITEEHQEIIKNKFGNNIIDKFTTIDNSNQSSNYNFKGKDSVMKSSAVSSGDNGRALLENDMLRKQVEEKNREIEYLKEQLEFFKDLVKGKSQ